MGIESNLEESAFKHKPPAKSKLIAITGITAFVVVAYLTYDLIKPNIAPCNSILEQTSVRLETKLNLLGSGTELKLGRQQIQELSAQAQLAGVTLKACCIVLDMTEGENQGFQECQAAVSDYQDSARQVTESVDAAIKAQKTGDEQSFDAAVSNIKETIRSGAEKAGQLNQILLTGTLRMQAVLTEGSDPIETLFDVYHAAQDIDGNRVHVNSQRTTTARYTLNAGRYFVHVTAGNASATGEFEVIPGQLTKPVIDGPVSWDFGHKGAAIHCTRRGGPTRMSWATGLLSGPCSQ